MKKLIHKMKWKKVIKFIILVLVIAGIGIFAYHHFFAKKIAVETSTTGTAQKVETRTIQNVLSGSGTVQPLNTYDVTTLVEGKVIAADFDEGDTVKKGQVLYKVSTDDVDTQIKSAQTKVDRAEETLTKAKKNHTEAKEKYTDAEADYKEAKSTYNTNVKSTETGIVKTLYIKAGDTVQKGTQIAEIYNNKYMLLTIPFSSSKVTKSLVGKTATVTIGGTSKTVKGTVTKVSMIKEALSGNRVVREVTIKVKNSGIITTSSTATAKIGSAKSATSGTFSVLTDTVITSDIAGTVGTLKIQEGDSASKGEVIFTLTKDSVSDQLQTYANAIDTAQNSIDSTKENVESAEQSLEDAKSSLNNIVDSKTDYSITAPISGKVVKKSALVGDTISSQSSSLCTIYDLSSVTFSMYVDELDIGEVKVGDSVNVTADALDGVEITGKVTNISLISNASSGVTQYPVTVQIDDVGDLLPGMNVTGNIVIEKAENCIAIPSDALQRGNVVYVKDDSVKKANGDVPAGYKSVTVKTGITDGDYVQITSGLTGTEEVYVKRNVSSQAATQDSSLLDGLGLGNSTKSGGPSSSGGGNMGGGPGGNGGGNMGGGGMPGGN